MGLPARSESIRHFFPYFALKSFHLKWIILLSEEYETWFEKLRQNHKLAIYKDLTVLKNMGPMLGRLYVDQIKGSKYNNLKVF